MRRISQATPLLFFRFLLSCVVVLVLSMGSLFANKSLNTNDVELSFSHTRKLYYQSFNLGISSNNAGARIIYTLDCSTPSVKNGIIYSGGIQIDSTVVIKAIAIASEDTSTIYTHSYLFPEYLAKQSKKPPGFPEIWGGVKEISADYEMDPEVVNDPDYSAGISEAFESLPSLSLTMEVSEWFDPETGLYVGYPNTHITREKPVTAEFIFNSPEEENFSIECGVQNQGGTSIVKWKSPKQSMRLLFKEIYGPTRLRKKLFSDSEMNSINTLVVDAMLNATWIHPFDQKQREHALYMRDQLTSDLYNKMGGLSFHGRYFNLFLNGLYWGICNLHERPDDAFLSEHLDGEREEFDVVKHGPDEIVSGSNNLYNLMLNRSRNGFLNNESLDGFKAYLDVPAFVDYMILNFYLGNYDWARHNFYAACNRTKGNGIRFYPWDSEHVIRFCELNYNNTGKFDKGGPTEVHTYLKENEEYRMMFADAVYKHLFNEGALSPDNFEESFRLRKEEIEKAIVLESARWGDYRESTSAVTYTKNDYWIPEVDKVLEEYIPHRRDVFLKQLRKSENKLFPSCLPPVFSDETLVGGKKKVTLIQPNSNSGNIFYTLDGSDPRKVGGAVHGKIYTENITIERSTVVKARFYSNNNIWSALAEKTFVFDEVYGDKVVINEIMYHPESDYPEFIELMNYGENDIDMIGFNFSDGIDYTFQTNTIIHSGEGLVLTNNRYLFRNAYAFDAFGQYQKQLSNRGELIILKNGYMQIVDSVCYSDSIPWPEIADGNGYSLELTDHHLDNSLWSSWKASDERYGTPYRIDHVIGDKPKMYPNPFVDEFIVELGNPDFKSQKWIVEVFSPMGRKIERITVNPEYFGIRVNLANLKAGLYLIHISPDGNYKKENIIIKAVKL